MDENLERLKQRIPLLEYLQRHNWKPCRTGSRREFVGLCPLHRETRPSFYVNAAKNLFYCHGCGQGCTSSVGEFRIARAKSTKCPPPGSLELMLCAISSISGVRSPRQARATRSS